MTKLLARDPARRCWAIAEWPEADRHLWLAALTLGDILEPGGARAHYRPISNSKVAKGYGRWLAWLASVGALLPGDTPGQRITPSAVQAYVTALQAVNRRQTLLARLQELYEVALVMAPEQDWQWLRRMAARVRSFEDDRREKRPRMVSAADLFELGCSLMERAQGTPRQRAVQFRDGLAIALLAARPVRRRNLAELTLHHSLVQRDRCWWLLLPDEETKTAVPLEMPWPEALHQQLETWLTIHRPILVACRGRWHSPAGDAVWISTDGSPMTQMALYDRIMLQTKAAFGLPLNPHLFRDCAATSIAIQDPEHVRIAASLLGHVSLATTERYYNQAQSLEAARHWQDTLAELRARGHSEYHSSSAEDMAR